MWDTLYSFCATCTSKSTLSAPTRPSVAVVSFRSLTVAPRGRGRLEGFSPDGGGWSQHNGASGKREDDAVTGAVPVGVFMHTVSMQPAIQSTLQSKARPDSSDYSSSRAPFGTVQCTGYVAHREEGQCFADGGRADVSAYRISRGQSNARVSALANRHRTLGTEWRLKCVDEAARTELRCGL